MRPGMGKHESDSLLKVSRDSHRIRKPPLPLPQVQYRPPIIIHTYSPKVIHTDPDDFMSLVQKLTGSSDTRLRLTKKPSPPATAKHEKSPAATTTANNSAPAVPNLDRQGSGSSAVTANCGSPVVSEDSSIVASDAAAMKQSNSPRSPFDASFEFDNVSESLFGSVFSQQVKAEPTFAFHDNSTNPLAFFADSSFMPPTLASSSSSRPGPPPVPMPRSPVPGLQEMSAPLVMDPMPPLSFLSGPDLAWSQSFLDCLPSYHQATPFPRQRFSGTGPDSSTMVALENIHAFMLT